MKFGPTPPQRSGQPFRRRSEHVTVWIVGAVLLACGGAFAYERFIEHKDCVDDRSGQVVDGTMCSHGYPYRWYYGGRSAGIGTKATGGSYERGGFGRFVGGVGG